jgi:hypothetical protein
MAKTQAPYDTVDILEALWGDVHLASEHDILCAHILNVCFQKASPGDTIHLVSYDLDDFDWACVTWDLLRGPLKELFRHTNKEDHYAIQRLPPALQEKINLLWAAGFQDLLYYYNLFDPHFKDIKGHIKLSYVVKSFRGTYDWWEQDFKKDLRLGWDVFRRSKALKEKIQHFSTLLKKEWEKDCAKLVPDLKAMCRDLGEETYHFIHTKSFQFSENSRIDIHVSGPGMQTPTRIHYDLGYEDITEELKSLYALMWGSRTRWDRKRL